MNSSAPTPTNGCLRANCPQSWWSIALQSSHISFFTLEYKLLASKQGSHISSSFSSLMTSVSLNRAYEPSSNCHIGEK